MWIKRKRYEKMENDIFILKRNVELLLNAHKLNTYHDIGFGIREYYNHDNIFEIQTELVPNLTLDELAKYIIDGKSIEREDTIKVKKIYS